MSRTLFETSKGHLIGIQAFYVFVANVDARSPIVRLLNHELYKINTINSSFINIQFGIMPPEIGEIAWMSAG
jgi:hypothetical protein